MAVAACVAGEKSVAPNPIASNAYHSEQVDATPARPKMSTTFRSEKMARLNPHQLPRGLRKGGRVSRRTLQTVCPRQSALVTAQEGTHAANAVYAAMRTKSWNTAQEVRENEVRGARSSTHQIVCNDGCYRRTEEADAPFVRTVDEQPIKEDADGRCDGEC